MGVLKFDLSDVEPGQDFDTPIPKGTYKMRILEIKDEPSKSDGRPMYTVELEVTKGDWKGRRLWDYIKYADDTSQWKLSQLLEALGVIGKDGKRKGSFNPEKFIGNVVVVRVKHEHSEDYGTQAKVGSMQPLPESEAEEAEEPEVEEQEESGDGEGGEEEITAKLVNEMDLDELKDLAEEQELEIKFTKRSKAEKKAAEIIEALELADEVEDPEDWDALAALDRDDLVSYIEQEEIEIDPDDHDEDDDLRKAVAEELDIEVPEDAEDDGDDDKPDYSEMSVKDLKATCSERGLETKGGKKALVKRLEEDDNSGSGESDPF